MNIPETILKVHELTGRYWKIGGLYKSPDRQRIELMLDNLEKLLKEQEGDLAQVESGGIIMRRDGEHIDVFIHIGETDE